MVQIKRVQHLEWPHQVEFIVCGDKMVHFYGAPDRNGTLCSNSHIYTVINYVELNELFDKNWVSAIL